MSLFPVKKRWMYWLQTGESEGNVLKTTIKILCDFCLGERLWDHQYQQLLQRSCKIFWCGMEQQREYLLCIYQFLNTALQHNPAGPCCEVGGWQRRRGSLQGDVLNKWQHDTAQTPCVDSDLSCIKEVYMLGHQHLLSAGYGSLQE